MVGWFFPSAHLFVDARFFKLCRSLWRQQKMIDADAVVFLPCTRLIVPKSIERHVRCTAADCVDKAQIFERLEARTAFGMGQGILGPEFGLFGIQIGWDYVLVSRQNKRFFKEKKLSRMPDQTIHEGQLVGKFFCAQGIAVGQVYGGYAHNAGGC